MSAVRPAGSPAQAGFTLLEILVALVVLGALLLALAQGTDFGLRAWTAQQRVLAAQGDVDAVDRALRRLVANAEPASPLETAVFSGQAHTLAFRSVLPLGLAAAGTDGRATLGLGVDAEHRLVLRWAPYRHVVRIGPAPPAREEVLLRGVERIDLAYGRAPQAGGGWVEAWAEPALPALVRLRIVFADRRAWPDIVVAPQREAPGR